MTPKNRLASSGFTLLELVVTVGLLGLAFAMTIPAYGTFKTTNELKGSAQNIAAQLRLAREKAIATGVSQTVHFNAGFSGYDYHVHPGGTVMGAGWGLPRGVTYYWGTGTNWQYRLTRDGRSLESGMVIVQNVRGLRDTVSVQASGLILIN